MCADIQHKHSKKSLPGESVSSKRTPSHEAGIVSADPGGAYFMTYQEQLKSPKWQKKRLEIMQRDGFKCRSCGDDKSQLSVHHIFYLKGKKVDEYHNSFLLTLCDKCHNELHRQTELVYYAITQHAIHISAPLIIDYFKALRMAIKIEPDYCVAYSEYIDNYTSFEDE